MGLESQPEALAWARKLLRSVNLQPVLVRADAQRLPFGSQSFDFVTCVEAIEHVERPERLVAEVRRVLKPGGVAVFTTPQRGHDGKLQDPFHAREFDQRELDALLSERFREVEVHAASPGFVGRLYYRATGFRWIDPGVRTAVRLPAWLGLNPWTSASSWRTAQSG